jgi:hypothetical protein
MEKNNNNKEQPTGVPETETAKPKEGIMIAGPTKKCPNCGEELPEKIAFCLYCMTSLIRNSEPKPQAEPQVNEKKKSNIGTKKILIIAAAFLALIAVVGITSVVTASILYNRQSRNMIASPTSPTPSPTPTPSVAPPAQPGQELPQTPHEPETPSQNHENHGSGQSGSTISLERAIEIGYEELASRGYSGTFHRESGMDWERGQWVWEILFRVEGGREPFVEMYINADTGNIVKFEWDD